jgi:hypothetical protein
MARQQADADRRREQREAARAKLAALFNPNRSTNPVDVSGAYAGISRGLAYHQARSGAWPSIHVGARWLILTRPFLALLGETPAGEPSEGAPDAEGDR